MTVWQGFGGVVCSCAETVCRTEWGESQKVFERFHSTHSVTFRAMEEPLDVDFTDKFKEIFDLCDVDSDGYIDVEHFKGLAKEHFGADGTEVRDFFPH